MCNPVVSSMTRLSDHRVVGGEPGPHRVQVPSKNFLKAKACCISSQARGRVILTRLDIDVDHPEWSSTRRAIGYHGLLVLLALLFQEVARPRGRQGHGHTGAWRGRFARGFWRFAPGRPDLSPNPSRCRSRGRRHWGARWPLVQYSPSNSRGPCRRNRGPRPLLPRRTTSSSAAATWVARIIICMI